MPNQTAGGDKKRVWILGAGFSRSLGGPLMRDLLSLAARRRILAAYAAQLDRDEVDQIFWLFHYGCGFPEGRLDPAIAVQGEMAWNDAEQFLETLDNAHGDPAKETVIAGALEALQTIAKTVGQGVLESTWPRLNAFRKGTQSSLGQLSKNAKRLVAASCCTFLEGMDRQKARSKERWLPYQQWLGLLRANDSILTFNYDMVVELLNPTVGSSGWAAHVVGVGGSPSDREQDSMANAARLPSLFKLHGSVNWSHDGRSAQGRTWTQAMLGADLDLAIATPGDGKMQMAGGLFRQLWNRAAVKLREADEITIIGFRFPQSDAFPRDKLLAAMRDNDNPNLQINVVLGPDDGPDLRRVLALLEWSCKVKSATNLIGGISGRCLVNHTLWAEDYLTVWAGKRIDEDGMVVPMVDFV